MAAEPPLRSLAALMAGPPDPPARRAVVATLAKLLEPLRRRHHLPACTWRPGTAAMRPWGRCLYHPDGSREIVLRILADRADGSPSGWRRPGALVATALHELAHLRYTGHGPRFWALLRQLLDEASTTRLYDPEYDDPEERGRGDAKLRGSAAHARAEAARAAAAAQRQAARLFAPGDRVRVIARGRSLAGQIGVVERRGRTRLLVVVDQERYWIPGGWLERLDAEHAMPL